MGVHVPFKPNLIKYTTKICDEDYDNILRAHKNKYKVAVNNGTTNLVSQTSKLDTDFIHQTGVFKITVKLSFLNTDEITNFDVFLNTFWEGDNGFATYYGNKIAGIEGNLFFTVSNNASFTTYITPNISSILNDGKLHEIQWIGNGTTVSLNIDKMPVLLNSSILILGGITSTNKLGVGSLTTNDLHVGNYEYISIINGLGHDIIKYNFSNGGDDKIPNSGVNAPLNSDLLWVGDSDYLHLGYGYFSQTSPNGRETTGWLLNMKRNPIDRIAKIKVLERVDTILPISTLYNFSGIEKMTVSGISDFERTSTFYYKAVFKNGISNTLSILWNNFDGAKGIIIETMGSNDSSPNSVRVSIRAAFSGNGIFVWSPSEVVSEIEERTLEIWYDGSSNASGVTAEVDGVPVAFGVNSDNLTASILTGSNGFITGRQKNEPLPSYGDFVMQSEEWTVDGVLKFNTNCDDNGDLVCVNLDGDSGNGAIDLDITPRAQFFITE